jgi:7-cyano-7-deazaguanine synthase
VNDQRAVVLLSGGLDSATVLAMARTEGFRVHALTVRYGQRHAAEVGAAQRLAETWDVDEHAIVTVDLGRIGGSALTDDIPVPKGADPATIGREIPVTYVPARNTVLLAIALAFAERVGAGTIFLGVNALDYSGYPDCRPEFIAAFERLAQLATKAGVEGTVRFDIRTPLIRLSKREIIQAGARLGVDYATTVSCYDPGPAGEACGACDACILRRRGFDEAGIPDPTRYQVAASS